MSNQIEEDKKILAKTEELLEKENDKNSQLKCELNRCITAYNGLCNNPKIEIKTETVTKEIPTIDNGFYVFFYVNIIIQAIVVFFHLYNSDYTSKLSDAFLYDIKIFFKYLISDFRVIAVAFLILVGIIFISIFLVSLYKNNDGLFFIMYLTNITCGFLIMDEQMLILSFKISHLMGFNYLAFHPFYLWFITMIITFFIFSIITIIKNNGTKAKAY